MIYPSKILHFLGGQEVDLGNEVSFKKYNPATGELLAEVIRGDSEVAKLAVVSAEKALLLWSEYSVIARANILKKTAELIGEKKDEIAEIIALECGKSKKSSIGEVEAAVKCGLFLVEQTKEFDPEKLVSGVPARELELVRQSIGVGALITPFNNPMAGIAWKTFPALLCGNSVVVKSHELTPFIAVLFARILKEAGIPDGVFNVVQGLGPEVGSELVENLKVKFVSFTGSATVGSKILKATADRLVKVSIEAGGKNPFIVCEDADLTRAVSSAVSGSFVDAGQRCAATSRIIIFDKVYDEFKKKFLEKVSALNVGVADSDDFGAIITEKKLLEIVSLVKEGVSRGAVLLFGGHRIEKASNGYFMEPTVLENVSEDDELSSREIFGPVVILYKVKNLDEAIELANNSEFRLSSAIHTSSTKLAEEFIKKHHTGVVRVNGATHGSEPHVSFGGVGLSGNGWREPGLKSLDFYCDWRQISYDN